MRVGLDCMKCLLDRQYRLASEQNDPEKAALYMKDVCRILSEADPKWPAPVLTPIFNHAFEQHFLRTDKFENIKKRSNEYVLAREDALAKRIASANDPLLLALKLARAGNYIDFGALGDSVSSDTLDSLLETASEESVDMTEYEHLLNDLKTANTLLYMSDNAGELVLDKLFIAELQKQYPNLNITLAVRGYPIINDATITDCRQVGIDKLVNVIENGSHIAGTYISDVSAEMQEHLMTSDVLIAKGQGNCETLAGCGLNVYYVFLCKCQLFRRTFNVTQLTGMFFNELRTDIKF